MGLATEAVIKRDDNDHGVDIVEMEEKRRGLLDKGNAVDDVHHVDKRDACEQSLNNLDVYSKCLDDDDRKGYGDDEKEAEREILKKGPPWYRSQRYIMAYVIFGGTMNVFFQRICFSIAIICMVNHTAISPPAQSGQSIYSFNFDQYNMSDHTLVSNTTKLYHTDNETLIVDHHNGSSAEAGTAFGDLDARKNNGYYYNGDFGNDDKGGFSRNGDLEDESCDSSTVRSSEENEDGPLLWDKSTQGILLGALYWTYLMFSMPSNYFIQRYRKKRLVLLSVGLMTLMTMFMHGASLISPWLVFAIRLVQGLCTALSMLALYGMWSNWAPPKERAGLMSLSFSGTTFASASVFPLSALLCKYGFLGGWPSVFYVFGFVCIVWLFLMWLLIEESPSEHPRISLEERDYIISSISSSTKIEKPKVPWWSIIKSTPVWAIILAQFSFAWGLFLFLSTLPLYMYEILKMDIKSNGFYSMFPYVAFFIAAQFAGQISDFLIRRQFMSVLSVRRMCNIITNIIPAILLIAISFLNCTQAGLAVSLLTMSVGATGFAFSCILVNPYDIAPSFAGAVLALTNMIATIPGIVTPYFVTAVTPDKTREQWQIVFFVTAAIMVIGSIGFCTLSSSHVQPWAREKDIVIFSESENEKEDNIDSSEKDDLDNENNTNERI